MRFPYVPLRTRQPVYSLGGASVRHRPIVPIHVIGPQLLPPIDGCIDSASDDTLFPQRLARRLGIDLTSAPQGESQPAGHAPVQVRYAKVTLLLADGFETCEWEAIVGFVDVPLRWALLGHAGFLDFFDARLRGARHEVLIVPDTSFPGQHVIHRPSPP